jgi:hypothetical protein
MRQLLFALMMMLLSGAAAAQPSFGVGVGSGEDCQDVARQIVHDWFEVRDIMTSDSSLKRPSAGQFQCVSPAALEHATPRRAGGSGLRCYSVQRVGVCCDAQLRACAAL